MTEKHGRGARGQALEMLDLFASVGVEFFDITHTNIDGQKRGFRPKQSLAQTRGSMPILLENAPARFNNVIIRPHRPPAVLLIQLDDLNAETLERVKDVSFMTLGTSPGNFQAWVAVENPEKSTDADFARRLRKGASADLSASGATRVAGSQNFKRKYEPDFPSVKIENAQPGKVVTRQELEGLGLVAEPEKPKTYPVRVSRRARGRWPSYEHALARAPLAHNSDARDVSRADFTWCMIAIDWGWSIEDTAERLLEESPKARENGPGYARLTAQNAGAAVDRRTRS